jgi:hypothetical protein
MKKMIISAVVVILALGVFTGAAAAQGNQPPGTGQGTLHEYMEQALADKLGLTLDQLEEQYAAGVPLAQIALDNGVAEIDLPTYMQEVRTAALKAAVADRVITQEQADRMLQRMMTRNFNGSNGTGTCPMGGMRGQEGGFGMRGYRTPQVNP